MSKGGTQKPTAPSSWLSSKCRSAIWNLPGFDRQDDPLDNRTQGVGGLRNKEPST